jgi:hypothetical protein
LRLTGDCLTGECLTGECLTGHRLTRNGHIAVTHVVQSAASL